MIGCQIIDDPFISGEEPLGRKLVFAAKATREAFERGLAGAGGSLGTWLVLNAVSAEGFLSQKALASRARVDGATISHHVDRAEGRGLVRRVVDPLDRRVRRLELTPEGKRLYKRLLAVARELDETMFAGVPAKDREALARTLDAVRANVDGRTGRR